MSEKRKDLAWTEKERLNCYNCQYREIVPFDIHSRCRHPETKKVGLSDNYIKARTEAFRGKADAVCLKLGIRNGGLTWPVRFNPAFLTACRGFRSKNDEKKEGSCRR